MEKQWYAFIGPIAIGKSVITSELAKTYDFTLLTEPVESNKFLPLFYENKRKYGFFSQISFYSDLFYMWDQEMRKETQNVIADSCLLSNLVFTELMGHNPDDVSITIGQHAMCHYIAEEHLKSLGHPTKYIVLKADQDILLDRFRKRSRKIEQDQLDYINYHYDNYFQTLDLVFKQYNVPKDLIVEVEIKDSVLGNKAELERIAKEIGIID